MAVRRPESQAVGPLAPGGDLPFARPMPCDNHGPFPFGAVSDLLGITRALYRASAGDAARRERLEVIGQQLKQALELAKKSGAGTLGRRAAWNWAEQGTAALGELVADGSTIAPLVRAAAAQVKR